MAQRESANECARLDLIVGLGKKLRLEVTARRRGADARPLHEEQICAPWPFGVARECGHDFDAVGDSVSALECDRPPMHRCVAADGVGVAARLVSREMLSWPL